MNLVQHEAIASHSRDNALRDGAPCPTCHKSVTPENWRKHFDIYHPGETVLPFPAKDTLAYADGMLPINRIRTDGGTQPRAQMNPVIIESYAEDMHEGVTFPAVVVYYDGSEYWLADGFHRMAAAKEAGLKALPADVHQGTRRDAVLFSVGANATHGLRRTNEDKRRAVSTLLRDDEWVKWSDREIARRCLVSAPFVTKCRESLTVNIYSDESRTYTTKHGTIATMNTTAIGKAPVIPFPIDNDDGEDDEPTTPYVYEGGYAYCKYCYTIHEDWRVIEDYLWQCERCEHNTHDKHMDVRSSPYDREVVTFCKTHGIDEVDVIQAWQAVFNGNPKAWKEAQRGYICGLDGADIAVEDADATAVLISADEEAYERAMRQREHIRNKPLFTSDSPEWYTPTDILNRVQAVMGAIDLDPCSNSNTAPNVPAAQHYTAADNGLTKDWNGRVYMNPPYGREIVEWIEKVVNEFKTGHITQALVLVPSRTDTEWYRMLRDYPRCFINGRLKFSESENAAPFPNMVVSLGCDRSQFIAVFGAIGDVYERVTA